MSNPLGSDFYCVDDIDPNLTVVREETALGQAIARRISTPRLGLWYDRDYGIDARRYMHRQWNSKLTSHAIETEVIKDERITNARCSSESEQVDGASVSLGFAIDVLTADGPYSLTLSVDELSVDLFIEES